VNAFSQIATEYERVGYAGWSYIMTPADFPDGCIVVTDAVSGRQRGIGRLWTGKMDTAPLGVPLCKGCDQIIVNDLCTDCQLVFTGTLLGKAEA
jgi:hypothetical protein